MTQRENSVTRALLRVGLDTDLAERLASQGLTLTKLRKLSKKKLRQVGVNETAIRWILDARRPPIPAGTAAKVLTKAAFTCCVCKDPIKSVVLHHIEEWTDSHSHEEDN